jgi:hypothetical protein
MIIFKYIIKVKIPDSFEAWQKLRLSIRDVIKHRDGEDSRRKSSNLPGEKIVEGRLGLPSPSRGLITPRHQRLADASLLVPKVRMNFPDFEGQLMPPFSSSGSDDPTPFKDWLMPVFSSSKF